MLLVRLGRCVRMLHICIGDVRWILSIKTTTRHARRERKVWGCEVLYSSDRRIQQFRASKLKRAHSLGFRLEPRRSLVNVAFVVIVHIRCSSPTLGSETLGPVSPRGFFPRFLRLSLELAPRYRKGIFVSTLFGQGVATPEMYILNLLKSLIRASEVTHTYLLSHMNRGIIAGCMRT
ncbi:hypothetical protein F4819DRAFT_122184 [Hypoxylon fuscum]|nr:hypothetical protein F4819DRAFT_122184 [Hypoxylon fuscum]